MGKYLFRAEPAVSRNRWFGISVSNGRIQSAKLSISRDFGFGTKQIFSNTHGIREIPIPEILSTTVLPICALEKVLFIFLDQSDFLI